MQLDQLKQSVEQEAAALTLNMYNAKQEIKRMKKRLRELSIISQTVGSIDLPTPKQEGGSFVPEIGPDSDPNKEPPGPE